MTISPQTVRLPLDMALLPPPPLSVHAHRALPGPLMHDCYRTPSLRQSRTHTMGTDPHWRCLHPVGKEMGHN